MARSIAQAIEVLVLSDFGKRRSSARPAPETVTNAGHTRQSLENVRLKCANQG